jgi:hypothetical protein
MASCLVRVSDLDRSLKFDCDVFSCRLAIREADVALLLTPKGFQIYPPPKRPVPQSRCGSPRRRSPDVGSVVPAEPGGSSR